MREGTLWVVSEPYYPEEVGSAYVMTGIAEGLAPHFPVRVLCAQPAYVARSTRAPCREVRHKVDIRRCWSTTLSNEKLLHRMCNLFTVSFSLFLVLLWNLRSRDLVLVVTSPPLLPFMVRLAASLRRARCLLLVHDVYPDAAVAAGVLSRQSCLTRILARVTRWLYRSYDRIVVIGRDMQALLERKTGRRSDEIVVIPNWGDTDQLSPMPRDENRLLADLGLGTQFVVQYAGNMGHVHDIESLLWAAEELHGKEPIHFLVMGSGKKKAFLERSIRERGLSNVTLLTHQPREQSQTFLNACDAAVSLLIPGLAGIAVPSRIYQIMAVGRPLIAMCDADSEVARVIREEQIGWVVPPGKPEAFAAALLEAYRSPERLSQMAHRARAAAVEKYSRQHAIESFRKLLRQQFAEL